MSSVVNQGPGGHSGRVPAQQSKHSMDDWQKWTTVVNLGLCMLAGSMGYSFQMVSLDMDCREGTEQTLFILLLYFNTYLLVVFYS